MEILLILIFLAIIGAFSGGGSSAHSDEKMDKDLKNFLDYEAAEHILDPDKKDNFFHF